jgi:hypothetical protein
MVSLREDLHVVLHVEVTGWRISSWVISAWRIPTEQHSHVGIPRESPVVASSPRQSPYHTHKRLLIPDD